MSKSHKKSVDKLRNSTHREELRANRHKIREILKEGHIEDLEKISEDKHSIEEIDDR